MEKNKNIPEIRFKGFEGEWVSKAFYETFLNLTNNTLSRAELNYKSGKYKNIHYGDVLIKFGELLDIKKDSVPYITNNKLAEKINSSILQNGDIIIADTAEDESVGKCTELINIEKEEVVSGLHTIPVRPAESFASKYLGYYLNSPSYHGQLTQLMQGIKVLSISKSSIKATTLEYPVSKKEQSQIGTYFQKLDKLITLEQQKYDKLQTLKKAMLEKMLPKEGADVPEIRFKEFEGGWKEIKLGDISDSFEYGLNVPAMPYDGRNKYIRITDIDDDSRLFKKEELTSPSTDLRTADNYILSESDILFARTGASVGKSYIYKKNDGLVYFAGFLIRVRIYPKVSSGFVFQNTLTDKYNKFIVITSQRSGQPGVNAQEYSNFTFKLPKSPEQVKIAAFLLNLDNLISLQKKKIEKLKNIKRACLGKMFISPVH